MKLTDDEIEGVRMLLVDHEIAKVKARVIFERKVAEEKMIRAEMKESNRKAHETEMIRDIRLAIDYALDLSISNEKLDQAARAVFRMIEAQHG